jgi:hypothetical protein
MTVTVDGGAVNPMIVYGGAMTTATRRPCLTVSAAAWNTP